MLYFNIKFIDHFMSLFFIFVFFALDIQITIINRKKIKKGYFCTKIMFSSTDKTSNVRLSTSGHESAKKKRGSKRINKGLI